MNQIDHQPVMLYEAVDGLDVRPGQIYIDATVGLGGHSLEIIRRGGRIIGLDQDPRALAIARTKLPESSATLIQGNFRNLADLVRTVTVYPVSGVLMDLGTSALQLQSPVYGLSFQTNAPLDMRLSQELAVTAKDLVNGLSEKELYVIFKKYAQEQRALPIARAIVRARTLKPITTTGELAAIVDQVYHGRQGRLHPATKVFQALRIVVNDEINNLKAGLSQALTLLQPGGRLAVISFHEGEDREVKQFIKNQPALIANLTKKPMTPNLAEIKQNPRARSAKLRLGEKI